MAACAAGISGRSGSGHCRRHGGQRDICVRAERTPRTSTSPYASLGATLRARRVQRASFFECAH
eukprot:3593094-Prymnesium_polylepis.1